MEASQFLGLASLAMMVGAMIIALTGLPAFGDISNRHVSQFYLQNGLEDTGSANIVNSIVWDFRGYDTLGEETVLFCSALGVFMIIRSKKYGRSD